MLNKQIPFRQLGDKFKLEDLGRKPLSFIIKYQKIHRKSFIVEIRDEYLDLYFLGHTVEVKGTKNTGYYLTAKVAFDPRKTSPEKWKKIVQSTKHGKWQVFFKNIKGYRQFNELMDDVLAEIVRHKKGDISEGISESNHFINNRDVSLHRNGILIIDKQVVYPGKRGRMDLLGLKRIKDDQFTFVIIELKNKNNKDIGQVFDQTKDYIDILWDNYPHFKMTYEKVLEQKMKLHLLRRSAYKIIPQDEISISDIKGLVVLDNYNIKSDLKKGGRLKAAIENWESIDRIYDIKLLIKTNVFDDCFCYDRIATRDLLERYIKCNSQSTVALRKSAAAASS